jgi:hypothetical protein
MSAEINPVDQILPAPRLLTLGLQHVLVMYAGAVAVPLIIGRALKLPPEDVAFLISADLFACGLATLVQCIGLPGVGIRLPVMMGVTFASVDPDAIDGGGVRHWIARYLWFGHRCRYLRHCCRTFHQSAVTAVSARCNGNGHLGDRYLTDASGYKLGRRRFTDFNQDG